MQGSDWTPSFMWKENGKKKQDSDWKPMCHAEDGQRESKKVINSQHVKPEEGDREMMQTLNGDQGVPGKRRAPRPRPQGPKTPFPVNSPPLARFNGEGRVGKEARDAQSL